MSNVYHVSKTGSIKGDGSKFSPFLRINQAAQVATAGDKIIVHEGVYRECVTPKNTGLSNFRRIIYEAGEGENVVIKGSEHIKNWEKVEGTIWKTELPNYIFKGYNPYEKEIFGDWLKTTTIKHLGDVYLNGESFYEAEDFEELKNPDIKTETLDHWTKTIVSVKNQEQTKYKWLAEVNEETTTIYANFHNYNPKEELVEINVRKCCFYPEDVGINYITVKGFEMAHAATPWSPPTADQPGLIGVHWSKGWIIEDNIIHDSKCSAISIGKESSTGQNFRSIRKDKPGYQYQLESVFSAYKRGWSKENIGSHIIRNNKIYDCGQNGIVGHLGCVFSQIYNNHIYNIALKREFYGHEIAGIKLHAAIDVEIKDNRIHDCSLGTWLDWQTQGTKISRNLFYNNSRDLFVEVSHGPYIVDHNILASDYALDNHAQGGAYLNNIIAGKMIHRKMLDRSTPYHYPHSTDIAGCAVVYGGDDRFYNNIFIGEKHLSGVGTSHYNSYFTSLEEYIEYIESINKSEPGDHELFKEIEQPVYINNNMYLWGAESFEKEKVKLEDYNFNPNLQIIEEDEQVFLSCELPVGFEKIQGINHSTETLQRVRIVDADFEDSEGKKITIDKDINGVQKDNKSVLGPINSLKSKDNFIKIWS